MTAVPNCSLCGGTGTVLKLTGTGKVSEFRNPCPACKQARRHAKNRRNRINDLKSRIEFSRNEIRLMEEEIAELEAEGV